VGAILSRQRLSPSDFQLLTFDCELLIGFCVSPVSPRETHPDWGIPPWRIDFIPTLREKIPLEPDFAVIGGGFTGLAAAAWLRRLAPEKSVVVLEAGTIGAGASGRTGGMVLAEAAPGDLPGLGDVLSGFMGILDALGIDCELSLPGAWEIGRSGGDAADSRVRWEDSGTLRVVKEVRGGTLDPGKLVSGLARAADGLGAVILEDHAVEGMEWGGRPALRVLRVQQEDRVKISAGKILVATNAFSLGLSGYPKEAHPRLTLAVLTEPLREDQLKAIGLGERKPFYTIDFPYLWGRVRKDNSAVWGAGLVSAPDENDVEGVHINDDEPSHMLATLERRVRGLHPALAGVRFTHRWGGPILFRDSWTPVFDWHPLSDPRSQSAIVLGAYAGHGVALSSYLGAWAAEALLGRRDLPSWGTI
jgi:glycine/D-amino acid oxidase-like deaminating enzyme